MLLPRAAILVLAMELPILGRADETNVRQPAERPNIVFILADQWREQAFGYTGDPNARTPHIDRLATQGLVLTNAISTCPVCAPYRASLHTGQYPLTHGVFINDVPLKQDAVSLGQAFRQAGYRTALIGKWHVDGHGRLSFIPPERHQGFEFWRACECTHEYNHSLYYGDTDEKHYWKGYDAIAQTTEAEAYIQNHRKEPFLLVLCWGPPHDPYPTAPERFQRMFKPENIRLRPNVPADSRDTTRRELAGYYAHCAALDECVGRISDTLERYGLSDNTILIFTSDHGNMLHSHGEWDKQRPYDESIRVPFVMRWPSGLGNGQHTLTAPLGTPDIMPTLLGLCGIPKPATVEGDDLSAWIRGAQPDEDRAVLIECPSPFGNWTRATGGREYRGLRTKHNTYVRSLNGPWLLFDNQADPYQQHNLIGDARYTALQAQLDTRLTKELKRRGDEFRPGEDYLKKWGYQTDATGTMPLKP